jgi:hypothetical protein
MSFLVKLIVALAVTLAFGSGLLAATASFREDFICVAATPAAAEHGVLEACVCAAPAKRLVPSI